MQKQMIEFQTCFKNVFEALPSWDLHDPWKHHAYAMQENKYTLMHPLCTGLSRQV